MTDFAISTEMEREGATPPAGPPPVKPPWLRPATMAAVIAAHLGVFAALMYTNVPQAISLDSINMDLVQEGDLFETEESAATEDTPPPETVEEPELALPPPMVMSPDAPALPAKKEDKEVVKKKHEEQQVEHAQQRREAQERRRYGAQGGRGQNAGASQATCLAHVASSIGSHTPGSTSLGPGNAHVTFRVNPGGGISIVSASGSSGAHAALARRIVASAHGPGSCGAAFLSQGFRFR